MKQLNHAKSFVSSIRVALFALSAIAATSGQAALTSKWGFDEAAGNIASNSVSSVNGTVSGGVTHVAGQVGQAYQFDGSSGSVNFGTNVSNFGTADFSVSFWMRNSDNRLAAFLEKRPACNMDYGTSWWGIRAGSDSTWVLEISGPQRQYNSHIFTTPGFNDGRWHHMVWQREGLTLRVYVDGVLNASTTTPGIADVNNSAILRCGMSSCDYVDSTIPYSGAIDELQFFNNVLSAQEVKAMYDTVIASLPPDCETSLALAQTQLAGALATNATLRAQLTAAAATNANLQAQLAGANLAISDLQAQLNATNHAYSLLLSQYNSAYDWNAYYLDQLTRIARPVSLLSSNFAIQYNSPGFQIPGATLDLQVSNIVFGIKTLEAGPQQKLFKLWNTPPPKQKTPAKNPVNDSIQKHLGF